MRKHTKELEFPDTPVTRTVYFGDVARGLPPGLSIKARTYERERLPGRWELQSQSNFDLLELKRTVDIGRVVSEAAKRQGDGGAAAPGARSSKGKKDQMVEIVRLSESILARSTYKSKHRKKQINMAEVLALIDNPTGVSSRIDHQLYVYLLETVHPLNDYRWRPLTGTEYERTHFVTRDPAMQNVFRATLDKRVTHYSFDAAEDEWIGVPVGTEGLLPLRSEDGPGEDRRHRAGQMARRDHCPFPRVQDPLQEVSRADPALPLQRPAPGAPERDARRAGVRHLRQPAGAVQEPGALREPGALPAQLPHVQAVRREADSGGVPRSLRARPPQEAQRDHRREHAAAGAGSGGDGSQQDRDLLRRQGAGGPGCRCVPERT